MEKRTLDLISIKFDQINHDKRFRNNVANAHGCEDGYGNSLGLITCTYPTVYRVSKEQRDIAKELVAKQKIERLEAIKPNQLIFVAMGSDFEKDYEKDKDYRKEVERNYDSSYSKKDKAKIVEEMNKRRINMSKSDIGNFRFRTTLLNDLGEEIFVEFSTDMKGLMHVDFSLDVKNKRYNYLRLEGVTGQFLTKENVLNFVNRNYSCSFTEFILDRYDLSPDDYKSISKKK